MEYSDATDGGRNVRVAALVPSHCRFVTLGKQTGMRPQNSGPNICGEYN
jgi:hypothetical protein